jgi:hypothetical protein
VQRGEPDTASVFIVGGGKVQRAALFQNDGRHLLRRCADGRRRRGKWGEITDLSAAQAGHRSASADHPA